MQTPWAVAGFAAHVRDLFWSLGALCAGLTHDNLFCLQSRVRCRSEVANDFLVARRAFLRANELRAGDTGRSENCAVGGAAREQNYGKRDCSSRTPQQTFALTVDLLS